MVQKANLQLGKGIMKYASNVEMRDNGAIQLEVLPNKMTELGYFCALTKVGEVHRPFCSAPSKLFFSPKPGNELSANSI